MPLRRRQRNKSGPTTTRLGPLSWSHRHRTSSWWRHDEWAQAATRRQLDGVDCQDIILMRGDQFNHGQRKDPNSLMELELPYRTLRSATLLSCTTNHAKNDGCCNPMLAGVLDCFKKLLELIFWLETLRTNLPHQRQMIGVHLIHLINTYWGISAKSNHPLFPQ